MTPEVQAYLDAKFAVNYVNQWAMVACLVTLTFVFGLLQWQKLRILREIRSAHFEQLSTKYLVTTSSEAVSRQIEEVPQKVAAIAADVAQRLAENAPSAGDGDLRRPPILP